MGEKSVGGAEMVKSLAADDGGVMAPTTVSSRRVANLAKLYAWCVAKDVLSLGILKVSQRRPYAFRFFLERP